MKNKRKKNQTVSCKMKKAEVDKLRSIAAGKKVTTGELIRKLLGDPLTWEGGRKVHDKSNKTPVPSIEISHVKRPVGRKAQSEKSTPKIKGEEKNEKEKIQETKKSSNGEDEVSSQRDGRAEPGDAEKKSAAVPGGKAGRGGGWLLPW